MLTSREKIELQGSLTGPLSRFFEWQTSSIVPGLLLTGAIAGVAFALRSLPVLSAFSPMILAIVIGILFHNIIGTPALAKPGITFSLRRILRAGIILLGLQLTFTQVANVGLIGVSIIAATLVSTFLFTIWLGRLIGVERKLAELIAAGTSICGASAVIATNTVTRGPDEDVAYAVACVTVFGSIAMFLYPLLSETLHLGAYAYGLWAGASIHEVAQVVGAAFQNGHEAGNFGTIAKLSRVMMLAPVIIVLGLVTQYVSKKKNGKSDEGSAAQANVPMPWFVLGFIALIAFNSVVSIPEDAVSTMGTVTTVMLSMALAAMGLETDFSKIKAKGMRPLLLGLSASVFIALFSLVLIKLTY